MNERTIFLNALEIPEPVERQAYLDQACAGDAALRQNVAALIKSHEDASGFLEKPAVEQMATSAFAPETPNESRTPTDVIDREQGKSARAGTSDETQGEWSGIGDHELSFLAAATKPGGLGRLGHYEIQAVIGKGGFGIVLKGFDERLHRVVAIKVLAPVFAANGSARKRFIREARAAAAVKNEHVVGIYDVQEEAQPPFLVMECIDGISLQDKLDKHGTLGIKEILRIGMQIAEGLTAAHKQGLVHRDIKPANILLENGVERVKITDFGLARAVDDASVTQSGTVAGTPMYMSPEQAEGFSVDHRSDLFSLGTVLYAMCTGHSPFRAAGTHAVLKRVIEASPRPIREINSEIPDWLCDIIAKLHAKKPADRFQTANEVAELLGKHLAEVQAGRTIEWRAEGRKAPGEAPAPDAATRPLEQLTAPRRWRWLRWAAAVAFVCAGGFLLAELAGVSRVFYAPSYLVALSSDDPGTRVRIWSMPQDNPPTNLEGDLKILGTATYVLDNLSTAELDLPAGNYLLVADLDGQEGDRQFIKVRHNYFTTAHHLPNADWRAGSFVGTGLGDRLNGGGHRSVTVTAAATLLKLKEQKLQATPVPDESGWVQLFNGKDLTGWEQPKNDGFAWAVRDGVLMPIRDAQEPILDSPPTSTIQTQQAFPHSFHLRAEVKVKPGADGKIFFWTGKKSWFDVSIGGHGTGRFFSTHSPLTPIALAREPEGWVLLEIIARRPDRITVKVNTITTADYYLSDADREKLASMNARIGLYATHNEALRFRKIEIKELPPPEPSSDLDLLQGAWKAVAMEALGKSLPLNHFAPGIGKLEGGKAKPISAPLGATLSVEGDIVTAQNLACLVRTQDAAGRAYDMRGVLRLDPNAEPRRFEFNAFQGFGLFGIYKLDGDMLTICYFSAVPKSEYPAEFKTGPDSRTVLYRFQRVSPKVAEQPGWVQLFNGKDLTGWKAHSDSFFVSGDGGLRAIPAKDESGMLRTLGAFENYELRFQYKLAALGDARNVGAASIVFHVNSADSPKDIHYCARLYVRDFAAPLFGYRVGNAVDSNLINPLVKAPTPGSWNDVRVVCKDKTIAMFYNGQKCSYFSRCTPSKGHIGFWASGGEAFFRKIEIKELPPEETGFQPLFNGKDFDGWKAHVPGDKVWEWENGTLVARTSLSGSSPPARLESVRTFKDFELRFQARILDSEMYLRLRKNKLGNKLGFTPITFGKGKWGSVPPNIAHMAQANEFTLKGLRKFIKEDDYNDVAITYVGDHITVKINGVAAYDGTVEGARDGSIEWAVPIYNSQVYIRKIEIKELPPPPIAEKGVLDYAEIHDADAKRFDDWIAKMKKDGFRPVCLSVQATPTRPRYTATALRSTDALEWDFSRAFGDQDEVGAQLKAFLSKRFKIAAHAVIIEEKLGLAVLWVRDDRIGFQEIWEGPEKRITEKVDEGTKQGQRVLHRSAVIEAGQPNFVVTLIDARGIPWKESINSTRDQFQAWVESHKKNHWRLDYFCSYGTGANTRFAGVLIQDANGPDWDVSWGLTPAQYEAELATRKNQGFRPQAVGHEDDTGAQRFSVIWIRYRLIP